jgi:hypothetical protein
MRELVEIFPEATQVLETAATHYDREAGAVVGLRDIIRAGSEAGEISDEQRAEVRRLLVEALAADRDAVAQIEAALKIIGG